MSYYRMYYNEIRVFCLLYILGSHILALNAGYFGIINVFGGTGFQANSQRNVNLLNQK